MSYESSEQEDGSEVDEQALRGRGRDEDGEVEEQGYRAFRRDEDSEVDEKARVRFPRDEADGEPSDPDADASEVKEQGFRIK